VGVQRNVKITYLQDTTELTSSYSYYLGVDWLRRIGSHHILIICDEDISLTKCIPSPHSTSSSNGMLTLSWLQVNPENFYSLLNYTRKLVLDRLLVSPQSLELGKIRKNSNELEQVFEIFNNESTILDGTITVPEWATTNVTIWELSIGEKMFVSITINISEARTLNGFIVIQCSIESLPLRIQIIVEVTEGLGTAGLVLIILSGVVVVSVIGLFLMITVRRKRKSIDEIEEIPKEEEKMVTQVFDLNKWKEILTDKEYVIFSELLNHDELTQTDLCRITSLSKSTVSRAISRLVAKGLIEKKKYGISNFVSIKRTIDS
ncbi:MAG: MarR family transcriptional regulator, partial [Candidatus Heimdallarchaeota archaeon]